VIAELMQIARPGFEVWIELSDLERIREALRRWCGDAEAFDGAVLHALLASWQRFVQTDWAEWDIAEYANDIGVRVRIQIAIEYSCAETAARIANAVEPADRAFQDRMTPAGPWCALQTNLLSAHPYFWETHTIHPELSSARPA
jgi:hypothetical protein